MSEQLEKFQVYPSVAFSEGGEKFQVYPLVVFGEGRRATKFNIRKPPMRQLLRFLGSRA